MLRRLTDSPFGRVLTTIRENPERAAFIGVNVRAYELAAFTIAGGFAGLSGALFGIFNRGVFADFVFWSKSADVMIMTILGGMNHFWGPAVGALVLTLLNQQITAYTEYWPFVLGTILVVLLFVFPGGILGALDAALSRLWRRRMLEIAGLTQILLGLCRCFRRIPDCRDPADRRRDRAQRRRQIDAVQPDHRALRPDSGRVLLDGRDITGVQPHETCRMGLGRSFQRTNIFPKLTVFENLQAAFIVHHGRGGNFWSRSEMLYRDEVEALLGQIGLARPSPHPRRHLELRQPEAARIGSGAGQRPAAAYCSTSPPLACRPARRTRRSACCSASPRSAV